ncbi:sigma-70 family RNA polymerase sigma factor [Aquabacterium sp. A7-Y]|uniref:sigma-70 family RNA polymerase sigma factor n=1 Tax=Aquabacterium sp. A7-Y TaxID=1349605 RepID=UPI00223DF5FC|nr:sigma-70 family RNA polymerase sigma factor [Aquabacterium sp. A7-Y]MCW7538809.1 sigma-70 family RNA polymerase sigma factor [Aquabacterium sp. A7-Y]
MNSPHDFAGEVQALRPELLRFARLQLRNDTWAEDAVSETLLAALEKPAAFSGRARLKTWLVGILKHKVIDQLRRHARECAWEHPEDEGSDEIEAALFMPDGHYREAPQDWGDPELVLKQRQFIEVMEACVERLPAQLGRVFLLREWLELDSDEICKELGITPTNLWVILHRARMRLRECLQMNWFDPTEKDPR